MNHHRAVRTVAAVLTAALLVPAAQAVAATSSDTSSLSVTPGTLGFDTAPDVPALGTLTLNGQAQTKTAQMNDWQVTDGTGDAAGWHVIVQGDTGAGKSPVFKEYCTDGTSANGCDTAVGGGPGPGYVTTSPKTLGADSLSMATLGAGFTAQGGTTGTAPTFSCDAGCSLDTASPVTIASAAAGAGMGTYLTASYAADSVSLAAPTTVKSVGTGNKAYMVDLTWTLASGPN
jgi:hypothetical protein